MVGSTVPDPVSLAAHRVVVGERAVGGEGIPIIEHVVVIPFDDQRGGHADDLFFVPVHRHELAVRKHAQM
jgi:hypothetical protein